ncbi:helix-turn-helix domain-containing protein [Vibrio hannami]|uniref:helix-turn-helix domain-containing protein n=1 Tax=Vibrio hannami TaxID=2717094 RepID=UPI00240EBBAE|nr:helix-turn-helix domain-containing protein [Vibrio hannami]MDG3085074.1 helix-turn-helix domain-containing protein [Vibrio hannami]
MNFYSINQLSELVELPVRTIRFYIQKQLVDRPIGERKAAKYSEQHVEQCLQVKKWSQAGLSLDKIALALKEPPSDIPEPKRKPGEINMLTSIHIAQGIELQIDQSIARLEHTTIQLIAESILKTLESKDD